MSDSTRSDKNPFPKKPGPPGVGTPFAGESSSGDVAIPPEKDSQQDPETTIIDVAPRVDLESKLADPDATIFDASLLVDANATIIDVQAVQRTPSPGLTSPLSQYSDAQAGAAELKIGDLLAGRYELLQLLGEGGMGAVYKARDIQLEREVALKVIKPELAEHPEILQRFKQELDSRVAR